MNASVPLIQELPWSLAAGQRTFVVCDTLETDGRFLLHTLATQVLTTSGRVLWIAGGTWTDRLIATALKKMNCDVAGSYLRSMTENRGEVSHHHPLHVIATGVEMAERFQDTDTDFDCELYMKELYNRIQLWLITTKPENESIKGPTWIVVDDLSSMATLLGERLVYFFLLSLRAMMTRLQDDVGLILRCSHDIDQEDSKDDSDEENTVNPSSNSSGLDWVGAASSDSHQRNLYKDEEVPWERYIVELADGIIDVLPLSSGYSREAHGRLVFTAPPGGRGWGGATTPSVQKPGSVSSLSTKVINYCLTDNTVMAIRLQKAAS